MPGSTEYTRASVVSNDGTTIGYRQMGQGPAVILLHGGMEASQHLMRLAARLADRFTVVVPDRRGRGMSGPYGEDYSVRKDCEDVAAVMAATGATSLFGLSSGALIMLRSALVVPGVQKVALYEPPLSIKGSAPTAWVARYEREIAQGKLAQALVTVMKGIEVAPGLAMWPRWALAPFFTLGMDAAGQAPGDDVAIKALIPTMHYDMVIVQNMADTLADYAGLSARVLLLGGSKSPAFLKTALDGLERTLPQVQRVTFPGLGHEGPTEDGKPEVVAAELGRFFA